MTADLPETLVDAVPFTARLAALELLAAGSALPDVAHRTGLPPGAVRVIAIDGGWPSQVALQLACRDLQADLDTAAVAAAQLDQDRAHAVRHAAGHCPCEEPPPQSLSRVGGAAAPPPHPRTTTGRGTVHRARCAYTGTAGD